MSDAAIEVFKNGITKNDKGNLDQAIADFPQAIELDPDEALSYLLRGACYAEIGDRDNAIADLKEVLQISGFSDVVDISARIAAYEQLESLGLKLDELRP